MKTITVMTNDSSSPESQLSVSGNVEKFVTITPPVVRLNGKIGEKLESLVKIVPEGKYPFKITKISAQEGKNIKYELKDKTSDSGLKEYAVTVENLKKDGGSYYDVLLIDTDSKIQPLLKINVMARLIDPNAPVKAPLTGSSGNILAPGSRSTDGKSGSNQTDGGKEKNFLEVIQKIQQQNATGVNGNAVAGQSPAKVQDPKRAEELKKKFEALIKQAQDKQKNEAAQKVEQKEKTE